MFCSVGYLPPSGTTVKNACSCASTSRHVRVRSSQGLFCLMLNNNVVIRPAVASFMVNLL
jgi:hypothetical protein